MPWIWSFAVRIQNWPGELADLFPSRNWIIHIAVSALIGLLLPSQPNTCIKGGRWSSSSHNNATSSCVVVTTRGSRECDRFITAIISANPGDPGTAGSCCSSACFFRVMSPVKFFCCVSSLCPPLPHWANASPLLNYRSGVAGQQQKWFNTPLKIHLAVLTANTAEAASCTPPKRKRTEERPRKVVLEPRAFFAFLKQNDTRWREKGRFRIFFDRCISVWVKGRVLKPNLVPCIWP